MERPAAPRRAVLACSLLLSATVLGLAGTDLVLPAIPALPASLGGSPATAQLVLAAFVAGAALGLLGFGELGARIDQRRLLVGSLAAFALLSWLCGRSGSLEGLVLLRLLQGAAGAAAAVLAPGMIRAMFEPRAAVRAIGLFGSAESLVPALAPAIGAWIVAVSGWRATFDWLAALALLVAAAIAALGSVFPAKPPAPAPGGYLRLVRDKVFLRYALSQAFTLGGLLTFVFGAPAAFTALGGTILDFVAMQVAGIAFFILGANLAPRLAERFGAERMIHAGTALSAAAGLAMLGYALAGGSDARAVTAIFVPVGLGLGLRGPPGFLRALVASRGDDARGAALVILAILATAAIGTAAAAPFVDRGLTGPAAVSAAILAAGLLSLHLLPRLDEPA